MPKLHVPARAFAMLLLAGCAGADGAVAQQDSAVQGGTAVGSHAFAVGISRGDRATCSGTLIAPNLVLTARHCVVADPDALRVVTCKSRFPAENVDPAALSISTEPSLRTARTFYRATAITTPYASAFCGNDLALVELEENIPAVEATPATPVVAFSMTDRSRVGGQIAALGYGITSPTAHDSGTRRVRERIDIVCVPGDESYDCTSGAARFLESDREFVTSGYVCTGDSGGGAFEQASFTSGRPYVLGVLSRGPQTSTSCAAAIYSRTDAHAAMIRAAADGAARRGGYPRPLWIDGAGTADAFALGTTCAGDVCTSVDATDPHAPAEPKSTVSGCSVAHGPTGSAPLVALAIGAVVARRRRLRRSVGAPTRS